MNRLRFVFSVLFLLSAVSLLRAEQQWVEVRSPHFTVVTDAGEKRGREVATRFEQMRTAFGVLFQKVNVNSGAPLQIIAFRNSKELRQVSPLYDGKPIALSGYFLGSGNHGRVANDEDRQYIALDLSAEDGWGTVFHEYAHLLINSNFPPTPVWFDEGFAEYCSSLKVDKKEIDIGLARPDLPQTLSESRWLRLVDLFSVGHESKIYNRDDRRTVFYAQSWITVHYFMSKGGGMMKQVSAYTRLTQDQHMAVPDAIRRAFGMEPEQLEKAIEGYFRGGSATYFRATAPPGIDEITFNSRPMDEFAIKTVLADLDFHTRDYRDRGIAAFQEILAKQPENATANRGLGYVALQQGDWEKAGEYFKHAAAGASKDPQVHYFLALLISRKAGMSIANSPEDLAIVKKELTTAISLDPNYADAYGLLGTTLSFTDAKEDAVNNLKKAIALSPRNEWYAINLANVYLRAREIDNAVTLLQQLKASSDPQTAMMADQQLQQVEQYKAAMARGGKIEVQTEEDTSEDAEDTARPKVQRQSPMKTAVREEPEPQPEPAAPAVPGKVEPVLYMKGTLVSVDCSQAPAAVLTVSSGGKAWKMLAPDAKKLIVIGAPEFSCSWSNRKISVNYRKTGENEGQLVTVELQ